MFTRNDNKKDKNENENDIKLNSKLKECLLLE